MASVGNVGNLRGGWFTRLVITGFWPALCVWFYSVLSALGWKFWVLAPYLVSQPVTV